MHGITIHTVKEGPNIPELTFVLFQCMFAVITPALIIGAFAERLRFPSFVVFIILWSIIVYYPMAHWVWGGGFMQHLGAIDFAGGLGAYQRRYRSFGDVRASRQTNGL